jgi:hypothetical protein
MFPPKRRNAISALTFHRGAGDLGPELPKLSRWFEEVFLYLLRYSVRRVELERDLERKRKLWSDH